MLVLRLKERGAWETRGRGNRVVNDMTRVQRRGTVDALHSTASESWLSACPVWGQHEILHSNGMGMLAA